jgi:hypothetical protein
MSQTCQQQTLIRPSCLSDSEGAEGVGYTYTVGRNGGAIADTLRREIPELIEDQEADYTEAIWQRLVGAPLCSEMLSSPRSPSSTMRIFSSAEYCRRVWRRMSFSTCSAGALFDPDFCFIFAPCGYDEPEILPP